MKPLLMLVSCCLGLFLFAKDEAELKADYPDLASVIKTYNPKTNKKLNQGDGTWLEYAYPKGGRAPKLVDAQLHQNTLNLKAITLQFLNLKTGAVSTSDYFTRLLTDYPSSGSIIAYPRSDFEVEEEFSYIAKNTQGKKVVMKGMLVNVKVILGYPAGATKLPTELVCGKTVDNLAKTGMPIPNGVGKPGKIKSLIDVAKIRYGASQARAFCAANPEGKVQLLVIGADAAKAKENVLPATY